jgi:hypothetical protein
LPKPAFLFDVNTLIAMAVEDHIHHHVVQRWFDSQEVKTKGWGVCPFTEAGFLRVVSGLKYNKKVADVMAILEQIRQFEGYHFWPISSASDSFLPLTAQFRSRLVGYRQVTDAYLLGLAIAGKAALVTMDSGIQELAGPKFRQHVRFLDPDAGSRKTEDRSQ